MDQQSMTTILTGVGVLIGLAGYLRTIKKGLDDKISGVRADTRTDIKAVREDMCTGFGEIGNRLGILEQRTYDLSTRLPPVAAATATSGSKDA